MAGSDLKTWATARTKSGIHDSDLQDRPSVAKTGVGPLQITAHQASIRADAATDKANASGKGPDHTDASNANMQAHAAHRDVVMQHDKNGTRDTKGAQLSFDAMKEHGERANAHMDASSHANGYSEAMRQNTGHTPTPGPVDRGAGAHNGPKSGGGGDERNRDEQGRFA